MKIKIVRSAILSSLAVYASLPILAGSDFSDKSLEDRNHLWEEFLTPPDSSRTKVWWFHGETVTTKEGIDADLREFKEKGVGGVVYYDQIHGKGEGAFDSMSPEWWDMLKYAAIRAKDYGLSFEVAVGNGYVSGGPWITPDLAMKKTDYVKKFVHCDKEESVRVNLGHPSKDFVEIGLVIFPLDRESTPISVIDKTRVISSPDTIIKIDNPDRITVRGISYNVSPKGKGSTGSMNIPGKPQEKYFGAKYVAYPPLGQLECSDDGNHWTKVTDLLPVESVIGHKSTTRSISFPAVSARHFRIHIHDWDGGDSLFTSFKLGNIKLYERDIVNNLEIQTGLRTEVTYPADEGGNFGAINPSDIIVCNSPISVDGYATITIPAGDWEILRFGYIPTGARVKHGRKNLLGYEADVMSAEAATVHYNNYFKQILDTLSSVDARPQGMCMDSHEAGIQNWTHGFETIFKERNGYDLLPWIPAFAGHIVKDRETTDKVLSDFRKTVTATISENYYGTLADLCRRDSVDFTSQAMLNILTDNISFRGNATKPQGEFWTYQKNGNYDCLDAASAAHIYGRNIASGEAFTDTPYTEPWDSLLRIANIAYCRGLNEFAICASSYQPWQDMKYNDSNSAHPYVFHRFHPEWNNSKHFWDYQARCSNLLRKGKPVVDNLVYMGEEAPIKTFAFRLPEMPEGYNFDVCSYSILKGRIASEDGVIKSEGGMTYKALIIPDRIYVSPEVEDILNAIANKGGIVIRCDKGESVATRLKEQGILPDMQFSSADMPDDKVLFFHRKDNGKDIYFVYNHSENAFQQEVKLRALGKTVEIWNPYDCTRETIMLTKDAGSDSVNCNLYLPPHQSRFIILQK